MAAIIKPAWLDAQGVWSQAAWIDYWSALWAAPTQPGYNVVVREGLAALMRFAGEMMREGNIIGEGAREGMDLLDAAMGKLATFIVTATVTTDPQEMRNKVVIPLTTQGGSPLLDIGLAAAVIIKAAPLRGWGDIFVETVAKPVAAAGGKVADAATSGFGGLITLAIGGIVLYLVVRD